MEEKDYYRKTSDDKVPVKWMAPESIQKKVYSHKTDVWSFGVVLWEMFSFGAPGPHAPPFGELTAVETALAVGTGKRMKRPDFCPPPVFALTASMWALRPIDRPSFADIAANLQLAKKGNLDLQFGGTAGVDRERKSSTISSLETPTLALSTTMGDVPPPTSSAATDGSNYELAMASFSAWSAASDGVAEGFYGIGHDQQLSLKNDQGNELEHPHHHTDDSYVDDADVNTQDAGSKARSRRGKRKASRAAKLAQSQLEADNRKRTLRMSDVDLQMVDAERQQRDMWANRLCSRAEAERVLQHAPEGTFLLREAAAEDTDLTPCGENMDLIAMLSVRGPSAEAIEHIGLVQTGERGGDAAAGAGAVRLAGRWSERSPQSAVSAEALVAALRSVPGALDGLDLLQPAPKILNFQASANAGRGGQAGGGHRGITGSTEDGSARGPALLSFYGGSTIAESCVDDVLPGAVDSSEADGEGTGGGEAAAAAASSSYVDLEGGMASLDFAPGPLMRFTMLEDNDV